MQDFGDILLHTERQWGKRQRSAYKTVLDRGLLKLARFPNLGRQRDDLRPGLHSHQIRQHVVYYRVESGAIRVDRILHVQMDAGRHLQAPASTIAPGGAERG